ncbi:MAG TPA: type II secretion system minor pseudopilin GspK [Steroidobacteraceae bacterium]|nr:type II secretion system minor pseudopilin GspK [Steroidobacteraceae bacterium]
MKHRGQRGIALLVAIVMFAIATTLAAAITYNKAMAARRAAATFALEQAVQAGMAAEALAALVLEDNANSAKTQVSDPWAEPVGPLEIEGTGVWIQAQLEDLTGRFNLNSLVEWKGPPLNTFDIDPHQVDVFRDLLGRLDIDPRFAGLLVDWLDSDIAPQPTDGGEDTLYLTQLPPYRPPNTFITHTSELLALPGFGAEAYAKIAPYVSALPNDATVNVCTASGQVLDAVESMNQTAYSNMDLPQLRQKNCFPAMSVFLTGVSNPAVQGVVQTKIAETSSWFRLRTNIRIGTAEFVLYSVLFREADHKVRTVQRSFGSE